MLKNLLAPKQVIFATKVKNKGKLDSHCWYFDGLAYLLQPEYCILFDAGERALLFRFSSH